MTQIINNARQNRTPQADKTAKGEKSNRSMHWKHQSNRPQNMDDIDGKQLIAKCQQLTTSANRWEKNIKCRDAQRHRIGMEKRKTNFVWNDWSTKGTKFTVWKQHSQSTEKYLYTRHCQTTVKNVNCKKKKVLYRYVGLHSWIALVYGSQRTS